MIKDQQNQMSVLDKVKIINLPSVVDSRGTLTAIESTADIPFEIKRIFYVHDIIKDRGGHAHIDTEQVVIAVNGSFNAKLFDGEEYRNFVLDNPSQGLYMPPMVFISMSNFTPQSVCLVIANTHYDITRSFRTKDDFINYLRDK